MIKEVLGYNIYTNEKILLSLLMIFLLMVFRCFAKGLENHIGKSGIYDFYITMRNLCIAILIYLWAPILFDYCLKFV